MTDDFLKPLILIADSNYVEYRLQEDDTLVYKTQINYFNKNNGVTIQNIEYPVPGYYINLNTQFGSTLKCGNIITSFFTLLKSKIDNVLLIVDFDGIEEVSDSFCSEYYKYLLTTKNKVITINQNVNVSNIFANFVLRNTKDVISDEVIEPREYPKYNFWLILIFRVEANELFNFE